MSRAGARALVPALAVAAALAAGCGDDDEGRVQEDTSGVTTSATDTVPTTPDPPRTETQPEREETVAVPGGASPEDEPGGAGDEEPARSQALVTGRGGKLSPRTVRVPPFIAIRVELRSADGETYALLGGGRTLRVDADVSSASTTFDGLRSGERLVMRGPQGTVTVEASAEPGP